MENSQQTIHGESTNGESNKPHPLLCPPVVQNIIDFLSIRDVLSARQICKEWNRAACIKLRSTKTLKFRESEVLEKYTNIMSNSVDLPFANYELEFYHMSDPIIDKFLLTCGNSITSLQLNNCRCTIIKLWEILTMLQTTLAHFSINCDAIENPNSNVPIIQPVPLPQIQSLTFYGEFFQNNDLIRNLIESCRNLSSLRLKCFDPLTQESPFEIMCFNVFMNIQTPSIYETLVQFQMESRLNDGLILELANKKFSSLQFLHISLKSSVQPESLVRLLEGLSNILLRLEIDFEVIVPNEGSENKIKRRKMSNGDELENNNEEPFKPSNELKQYYMLPKMSVLRRLSLSNYNGSLTFINNCENLKYLTLVNCDISLPSLVSVEQHSNLICFVSSKPLDLPMCTQLARISPNLKTLNVTLDDEVLSMVFKTMHNLEELILSGDQLTDEGVTGVENIYELMTIYNSMENMEQHLQAEILKLRKGSYIGNLTKLKKIHILNAGFISDASVCYGISDCKDLEEISLLNSEVSDSSLSIIGNKLPKLRKLEILSNIPRLTENGKFYIRNKIPNCDFILGQSDILNRYRTPKPSLASTNRASPMEVVLDWFY